MFILGSHILEMFYTHAYMKNREYPYCRPVARLVERVVHILICGPVDM